MNKYQNEYKKKNYDRISFDIPKGKRDELKEYAKNKNMKVNEYIKYLITKDSGIKFTNKSNEEKELKIAKELATLFLHMDMNKTELSPMIVMHPIFESAILCNEKMEMFNAFDDTEKYQEYLKKYEKSIQECETISDVVCKIRKSYVLTFIYYLKKEGVSKVVCANELAKHWTRIETLTYDVNVRPKQVLSLIKCADKESLMNEDELEIFNNLDDEITIWRGSKSKNGYKGCSYTLDEDVAKWFANRYDKKGYLFKAKIKKEDVIAYKTSRSETELIVDYNKIYDVQDITE